MAAPMNPFARGLRPIAQLGGERAHGTRLRYMAGCKCFACRRSNSDYEWQRKVARMAGDWNGVVDAARARVHLLRLQRSGVGRRSVAAATDLSHSILAGIRNGERVQLRARTERKILAVGVNQRADGSLVNSAPALRMIARMIEEGMTRAEIARRMGFRTGALQFKAGRMTARNVQRVKALYSSVMI